MLRTYLILSLAAALPGCFILLGFVIVLYALARRLEVQLGVVHAQLSHALQLLNTLCATSSKGDDL